LDIWCRGEAILDMSMEGATVHMSKMGGAGWGVRNKKEKKKRKKSAHI